MNNTDTIKQKISYSVAIRTLGTSGEKYVKVINSIKRQNIKPEKIVVVLPKGFEAPQYRIDEVTVIFSEKGMITQRLEALNHISSQYILFCDDDVEFENDFVEKLAEPLINDDYTCSAGPLLDFFPPSGIKYVLASLLGGACTMLHGRKNSYVRILNTGGWSYNHSIETDKHKYYRTESLPWTCFFIQTEAMRNIHFEDEMWLERNGYAAFEDRVMFYKLLKNGYQICVVSNALYIHNDAKTSLCDLRLEPIYAKSFNHYVFWHRYIYSEAKHFRKIWAKICINYYILMQRLYQFLLWKTGRSTKDAYFTCVGGFDDARSFIHGSEYTNLKSIHCGKRQQ